MLVVEFDWSITSVFVMLIFRPNIDEAVDYKFDLEMLFNGLIIILLYIINTPYIDYVYIGCITSFSLAHVGLFIYKQEKYYDA